MKKLFLVLCLVLSFCCNAQMINGGGTDGFFQGGFDDYERDPSDISSIIIASQNFGEPAPLGDGLVILGLLGLGYLAFKKRKVSTILICSLFLFSCHHKQIIELPETNRRITVTFNTRSSKTSITPTGIVTFTENDILHVFASGINETPGRYLGYLTNGSNTGSSVQFTGTIDPWYTGEEVSIYYLGQNVVNKTGETIIDFSDQSYESQEDLSNISKNYHISRFKFTAPDNSETTAISGQLKNMMALAVFNTSEFTDDSNVKILGLNNMVKIYPSGTIEYGVCGISSADSQFGHIIIGRGTENKYVVLLPESETEAANVSVIFTSNEKVSSSALNLQIGINSFLYESNQITSVTGYNISATDCNSSLYINYPSPEDCMSETHLFTVAVENGTRKQVVFSQGNLVYDQGRFKQHRYPWGMCQINSNADINVGSTFDRFGWGASGYTFGQPIYQPYTNSTTEYSGSVSYGYGPLGTGSTMYKQSFHPHEKYRKQDWGWYQFGMGIYEEYTISLGNNSYWRTLGQGEWTYVFNSRETSSTGLIDYSTGLEVNDARFVKATINDVRGVILFPDFYTHPDPNIHLSYINSKSGNGFTANNISTEDFWTLHDAGVEFLPINSYYDKISEQVNTSTSAGYYWSSKTQMSEKAIYCKINTTDGITTNSIEKYQGLFVRLVFQVDGLVYK